MANAKRVLVCFYYILLISIIVGSGSAEGNITTTSGDLYLNPASGYVKLAPGTQLVSPTSGGDNARMYNTLSGGYDVYYTDVTGGSNQGFIWNIISHRPYVFQTTADQFQFQMRTGTNTGHGAAFLLYPGSDASNEIGFYLGYDDGILGGMGLEAQQPQDKVFFPFADKQYDLGRSVLRWKTLYVHNISYTGSLMTNSRGYLGDGPEAYAAVSKIQTLPNGEINHTTVDPSLGDKETIDLNAVTFANSKAITYLMDRIEALEKENQELKKICMR